MQTTPKNPIVIANVLLEEIGHYIDSQINVTDSPGDEGAIFAALVQNIQLDKLIFQSLKAEDDSIFVTLNGQKIELEQAENGLDGIARTPYIDQPTLINRLANLGKDIPLIGKFIGALGGDIPLEGWGWVWVNPEQKYQNVTGVVKTRIDGENDDELRVGTSVTSEEGKPGSFVTHTDFPAVHDSHDQNTIIQVDPGYEFLLSKLNEPGQLEIEWETGIRPDEYSGDGVIPIFPKWVWPSPGDRIWANGSWIYDVGHGETGDDGVLRFRSEIHPPRAFATMRDQVIQMPNTGSVPVHVTATDLYIHGDGGYASEILNGGQELLIKGGRDQRFSPINENFNFQIQLPDKPADTAIFTSSITDGPGNTFGGIEPQLSAPRFDEISGKWIVDVTVPLAGTGITPEKEVYARHINVGWAYPTNSLHHLRITLTKMILKDDQDGPDLPLLSNDGELTFSWLDIDRAGSGAWQRLSDQGDPLKERLKDFGDGDEINFPGPTFDFYVANNQPVVIRSHIYEQDGFDDLFGNHNSILAQGPSYLKALIDGGPDDPYNILETFLQAPNYNSGEFRVANPKNQFILVFRIEDIPLRPEEVNQAPVAVIKGSYSVAEGSAVRLSSEGSYDPDGSITSLQWDLNGDGKFDDAVGASPVFSATTLDGPASRPIALRVIDNLGVTTTATSTINIINVPPTSFISGDFVGVPGLSRSFILSATDPSQADTAAGFTFKINFGDGTNQTLLPIDPLKIQHIFSTYGTKTITVTATDKDGGVSKAATHQIDIKAVALIPDPTNPTLTDLIVGGTPGDDLITVTQQGETGSYRVIINNEFKGDFSPTRRIIVYGIEGQDRIIVPNSRLPVEMFGGDGSDELDGGFGDIAMFGGKGNDFYKVDSVNDRVIESPGPDLDTVNASIDYRLGANLENLNLLEGTAAFTGIGNELSNTINGNSYNNYIDGGDGSDTLYGYAGADTILGGNGNDWIVGGQGNDILTGGPGNDIFAYTEITDAGDLIMDFTVGRDKIEIKDVLRKYGYSGSQPLNDGYLKVSQVNAGLASLQIDLDGFGNRYKPVPFILLKNVQASSLDINSFTSFIA